LVSFFLIGLQGINGATDWKWHQRFPWVYSDKEQGWQYWQAGSNGSFYHWKNNDRKWYRFDTVSKTWVAVASTTASGSSQSSSSNETVATGSFNLSLEHDGLTREYQLYVPTSYDGSSRFPLLFNFHGFGGTVADHLQAADMRSLANSEKFLLVYPQGSLLGGSSHWNAATSSADNKSSADDIGFVRKMITSISASHQVNADRIYACGYSNGAFFSYYLACYLSDQIAGVGSVSGTMLEESYQQGQPTRPVPMINLHGTADFVVPYAGGEGLVSIPNVVNFWIAENGAESTPSTTTLSSGNLMVERSVYSDSNGTSWVEHYKVNTGGHVWFDLDLSGSDTNSLIWSFLSKHGLQGPIQ
jgi:polyhydroxybutyrate depolymerase